MIYHPKGLYFAMNFNDYHESEEMHEGSKGQSNRNSIGKVSHKVFPWLAFYIELSMNKVAPSPGIFRAISLRALQIILYQNW